MAGLGSLSCHQLPAGCALARSCIGSRVASTQSQGLHCRHPGGSLTCYAVASIPQSTTCEPGGGHRHDPIFLVLEVNCESLLTQEIAHHYNDLRVTELTSNLSESSGLSPLEVHGQFHHSELMVSSCWSCRSGSHS